jgi:hypothetical protein
MTLKVIVALLILSFALAGTHVEAQYPPDADQQKDAEPRSWEIEGEYEIKLDFRKNFALDRSNRDDLFRFDQEFQLRWSYRYNDWISLLIEGKVIGEHELYTGGGGRRSEVEPERGETWVRFENLFSRDLSLKLGRQSFEEPRRWWWDDDLDAAGLKYRTGSWLFEFGAGEELPRKSLLEDFEPENKRVMRVLARANWLYFTDHAVDLFFLHHHDRSPTQSIGALFDDAAGNKKLVTSRRKQRVRGWAVDVGGRWESQLPGEPIFTLGHAIGSGDKNPDGGTDRAFRQTGLQSNDEEFRTYGELLRPELSNLSIPVLAVQFPIFWKSHIEFAYRYFRQVHAAPFLRDARIEAEPNGVNKNIGHEWMFYSVIKQWKDLEIELAGAAFKAGNAYGARSGKMAYSLFTQLTFSF